MLNEEVLSAVAIGNLKAISEQPAMLSNLAFSNVVSTNNLGQQNAVANQQAVSELGVSIVAAGTNTVSNLGPLEARSAVDILTNNELAQTIADLKSTLQAFSASPGGGGGSARALLQKLIDLGIRIDGDERVVVKPGTTVIFPGKFSHEQVEVRIENHGVVVKVKAV